MKRIPEFRLVPQPLTEEAASLPGFKFAPADVGTRHKLGGTPDFIQADEWPTCRQCRRQTSFVGQFDSVNDDFIFADCGLIYVFFCFDCMEPAAVVQSY
jgi:hypothetical protein